MAFFWGTKLGHLATKIKQGVCHIVALPFALKSILRQKKSYENLNISPCKNINFKKKSLKETKIFPNGSKHGWGTEKDCLILYSLNFLI
jgi:hypothetical protein